MKRICTFALAVGLLLSAVGCKPQSRVNLTSVSSSVSGSEILIKVAGDNMFHKDVLKYAKQEDGSYEFDDMYMFVDDYMKDADITVINQETAIVDDVKRVSGYPSFGVPETICETLDNMGVDVVLHANNHITDKDESGVKSTLAAWKKYPNIVSLGIHETPEDKRRINFVEVKGVKIGMLNYTYGVNRDTWPTETQEHYIDIYDEAEVTDAIARANTISDIVIMFLHAGQEYRTKPDEELKTMVNHCIDSGADIVINSHPHTIQPYEYITTPRGNSGLVYYSLGNFASGQTKFETLLGGVAEIKLKKETTSDKKVKITVTEYGLEPVVMHNSSKAGISRVFKLRDYTDELALASDYGRKHKKYNVQSLWDLYTEIIYPETKTTADET